MKNNRYAKLLAAFLILMLALTLVSRAADSVTVAKVTAESAKRGVLVHDTVVQGTIEASDKIYIGGEKDFRVSKIHAKAGTHVKVGDPLFTLDGEAIREKLDTLSSEIELIRLDMEKLRMKTDGESSRAAVDEAEAALNRAVADDALETELNGGKQLLKNKRAIEDAQQKLNSARRSLEEETRGNGIDIQRKEIELRDKLREQQKLQALHGSEGVIKASTAGTIGEVLIKQGAVTTGEDLCTIIPDDSSYEFHGELDPDKAKYMEVGDPVQVVLGGKRVPLKDVVIKSIQSVAGEQDGEAGLGGEKKMRITAELAGQEGLANGQQASLSHSKKSEEYNSLVPLSAVRGTEGANYVLVVSEKQTVLGSEAVAEKLDIEVLEKDNKNAAVSGSLDSKTQIITAGSKPIVEGDRVREQKK